MFCKECGTENLDTQVGCIKCKTIINNSLPLNGTERIMIIGFFVLLLGTLFLGIIPIIFFLTTIYIIKKDKSFNIIKNIIKINIAYWILLSTIISGISLYQYNNLMNKVVEIKPSERTLDDRGFMSLQELNNKYTMQEANKYIIFILIPPICAYIFYLLSNILFFNILKKHENWVINNGIFSDYKGEKSFIEKTTEKLQTIKKEPINTTDELLKWAELKEKGLISDDEYQKVKEKILEGKL